MSEHGGEPKALDRVTEEMRNADAPDVDWDRMEQKLFARIDADEGASRRGGIFRIVAALAAAAAILLLVGGLLRSERSEVAQTPTVTAPSSPRVFGPGASKVNGAALAQGDQVVADKLPLLVDHPGRARWTLDPEGQATMTRVGEIISLKLTRGALSAEVVPSDKPETFVVEVEGARVAVHGTAFRVVRGEQGVDVSVTEGVVAVGGQGQKPGYFLRAGDSGKFAKDGLSGDVKRAQAASHEPTHAGPKSNGTGKPALAASPTAVELGKALDQISAATTRCFANDGAKGEVRLQVQTQLDVSLGADGKVRSIGFEPPLSPAVTECVQREAAKVRVPESAKGATAQRALLLGS